MAPINQRPQRSDTSWVTDKPIIKNLDLNKIRARTLAGPKSLRSQLIVSIWAGLAVILIPINIATDIHYTKKATLETQKLLVEQGSFVYFGITKWRESTKQLLEILSFAPPIRKLDQDETEQIFDRLNILFPYRSWRLWSRDGDLLVGTNVTKPVTRKYAFSRSYFLKSRQGEPAYGIYQNCIIGQPCYVESVPVYAPGVSSVSTSSSIPSGVLSIAIGLSDTPKDSGLGLVFNQIVKIMDSDGKDSGALDAHWNTPISLQNNDFTGLEVMMVSRDGYVIFPESSVNDKVSLQTPAEISKGPWGPFVKVALHAGVRGNFGETESEGRDYFVYSKKIDSQWSMVAITDKESSYATVRHQIMEQLAYQLITLLGATIVIALVCRKAAEPIQLAASTIKEFSSGNFEARIATIRKDEIGKLFEDINQTGYNLRRLLTSQLEHAVTDQQIQTATNIQKSFVIEDLPSSEHVELAADFDPAYDIGADWYDAVDSGDITYVVIADVCDKGIASALFMSVFRSLIRYSLLDEDKELAYQGLERSLDDAITQVNNYMATNHAGSSMFATLFLGAFEKSKNQLSYVCAGHESPIIVRELGVLDELKTTGPAIGIFDGAKYEVNTTDLQPGQLLFTYTDGLVDSRSPSDKSFGLEGVKGVLANVDPKETTAKSLLDQMTETVSQHRADAEQFDDLTMLVMKIK
ncbi:SpoIIE family protein phosphatase [Cyanobium sp. HWJ4-Hawea]|uniref:PP2C family protein-serine/threonine phosphatase n=1 Tax=unclassified Cyanobium TaxID=2627006 RepID=UPI0020CD4143|nr:MULTISPECIES: SpoIIE family protein phosphatase [unclassified Cyanobium]MCP9775922.1 SpoIIE family protein phosphatase [Cyanobium sp. WAJ14-Wanaka]MCP9808739.1 SpoIIE family protein phosphatase [Cyanobium sp. HWJ4-Hawea]